MVTSADDSPWRRPQEDSGTGNRDSVAPAPDRAPASGSADGSGPADGSGYTGPPQNMPPQPGWRPEFVVQPAPPRALPAQDHGWIDVQEAAARTVTYGVGLVAGAIMLVALFALCGRLWI